MTNNKIVGGTFPGECQLQESESDYCKVKVMTNNKIIGGTFPGEFHLQENESDYSKVKVMTNNKRMGEPSRENVISKKVKVITAK